MNIFGITIVKTSELSACSTTATKLKLLKEEARKHIKDFKEARQKYRDPKTKKYTKRGAIAQKAALKRLTDLLS